MGSQLTISAGVFQSIEAFETLDRIKKLLGEQNMDYIGSALQSHLNQ